MTDTDFVDSPNYSGPNRRETTEEQRKSWLQERTLAVRKRFAKIGIPITVLIGALGFLARHVVEDIKKRLESLELWQRTAIEVQAQTVTTVRSHGVLLRLVDRKQDQILRRMDWSFGKPTKGEQREQDAADKRDDDEERQDP